MNSSLDQLLANVQIYWDPEALVFEHGQLIMKPLHDDLYQLALDLKLASLLVLLEKRKPLSKLRQISTSVISRPRWWPANPDQTTKTDMLVIPRDKFDGKWNDLRMQIESKKTGTLWHDDPALITSGTPTLALCRTASVGHEGNVFYFVYKGQGTWKDGEQAWEKEIISSKLPLFGSGAHEYQRLVRVPGKFAEPGF